MSSLRCAPIAAAPVPPPCLPALGLASRARAASLAAAGVFARHLHVRLYVHLLTTLCGLAFLPFGATGGLCPVWQGLRARAGGA